MTTPAKNIIQRAGDILQDKTAIRWAANELVRWLNDGQREVLTFRPDALNVTATMTLAAGSRQDLDNASLTIPPAKLIDVTRNMASASKKGAVRIVSRALLDAQDPGWHARAGKIDIEHYTIDEAARDPKTFYVYPPALNTAQLEIVYAGYPVDIAEPADGATYVDVVGNMTLPDHFGNALLDYVLSRAYSKDAEHAANLQLAGTHYAAFTNSLGVEVQGTAAVQPRSPA